jgi:hypothetical protein
VLIKECYGCHSNKSGNVRGGLRLDTKELMAIGGSTGPAIVPGNLEESWLYNAINHEDYVMPPKRKLSQNVINDFKTWIEMGAPDPRTNAVAELQSSISEEDIQHAKENFWAYSPSNKHRPKLRTPTGRKRISIDSFWRSWKVLACIPPTTQKLARFSGGCVSIWSACHQSLSRSICLNRCGTTILKKLSRVSLIVCLRRSSMANAGAGTGWTLCGTLNPQAALST